MLDAAPDPLTPTLVQATQHRPDDPRAWRDLIRHHRQSGRLRHACRAARDWTKQMPGHGGAWLLLGNLLDRVYDPWSADAAFEEALRCAPDHVGVLVAAANHFRRRADYDRSLELLEHAMAKHALTESLIGHYAITLARSGRTEAAAAYVEDHRATVTHPYFVEAAARCLTKAGRGQESLELIERGLARPGLKEGEIATLEHQRGVAHESLDQWGASFAAHTRGNRALGPGFDRAAYDAFVQTALPYIERFEGTCATSLDDTLIFVVGMPRSGSTLLETILTVCADIESVGEAPFMQDAMQLMATEAGSTGLRPAAARQPAEYWDRHAAQIMARYRAVEPQARHIVDKMLFNYDRLDFIARLFPGSRVVVTQRHPYDTCLSAYFQNFDKQLTFTRDLTDIGHVYREHRRFLAAAESLPLRIHTVAYESLVDHLEPTVRELLDFLGQPFDPACLAFHENPRQFATASHDQVRRPLYRSSMGRWQKFHGHLEPLYRELPRAVWE